MYIFTKDVVKEFNAGIANGTKYLGAALPNKVLLSKKDFVSSPYTVWGDLEETSEPGLLSKQVTAGPQTVVHDQATGQYGILLKEPTGGFNFILTADLPEPITIYGYGLVDNPNEVLIASGKLPVPVVMQKTGDYVQLSAEIGFFDTIPYKPVDDVNVSN